MIAIGPVGGGGKAGPISLLWVFAWFTFALTFWSFVGFTGRRLRTARPTLEARVDARFGLTWRILLWLAPQFAVGAVVMGGVTVVYAAA